MPDNPTEKVITEQVEDGEDFCCELPHTYHSNPAKPAQTETLTVEQAQRLHR